MRKTFFIILIPFICIAQYIRSQEVSESCTVTYVANEGFLISTDKHKILIDALFGNVKADWCAQPSDSVANLMIKGLAPFDNIDAVLVTHKHFDHFDAGMTIRFMKNNTKALMICPAQVNEKMMSDKDYPLVSGRIISLKTDSVFDSTLTVNNIGIRALRLKHGAYLVTDSVTGKAYNRHSGIENMAYLIKTDGFTFFHSGDDSPANSEQYKYYKLGDENMDVAFLDRVYLGPGGMDVVNEYIHCRELVFMHIDPNRIQLFKEIKAPPDELPQITVFSDALEKKVIGH